MKKSIHYLLFAFGIFESHTLLSQSSYTAANYAIAGDTLYLTSAQLNGADFDTTGANINWDYSTLAGNGQRRLLYRTPVNSGVNWTYVLNPMNSNLSSSDEKTYSSASVQYTDPNDFYYKNASELRQVASSSKIVVGGVPVTIKNQYNTPDVQFVFPIDFGDKDSSTSSYTSTFSTLYYRNSELKRVNEVVGWGSLQTPFGNFANCLKMETYLTQSDSVAIDTITPQKITTYYREYRWLDPSKKYPLLYVKQSLIAGIYVTETIEYMDNQQYFQPNALFGYYPVAPVVNDTVTFQNLSSNGVTFAWDFGDASSASNTSTLVNPIHVFANPGVYNVRLITHNGPLSDTLIIPVSVATVPTASFTYSPGTVFVGDTVDFTNTSLNASYYNWSFGDAASGINDTSLLANPYHIYLTAGSYQVMLIANSIAGADTVYQTIVVNPQVILMPTANFNYAPTTITEGEVVSFTNSSTDAVSYTWDFGDPTSGAANISSASDPTHVFNAAGTYLVQLIATNANGNDTLTQSLVVNPVVLIMPTANFTYAPTTITEGEVVSFTNSSADAVSYTWDFGDPTSGAANISTASDPTYVFNAAGTYLVQLIATNANGNDTLTQSLVVNPVVLIMPTANFTYAPTTITEGEVVSFTNSSTDAVSYTWDFGDPTSGAANISTASDPTHVFNAAGTYLVQLIATNANGNDTIVQTLMVNDSVTGIKELHTFGIRFYPNPASDLLQIEFQENTTAVLTIYDTKARKIWEGRLENGKTVNLDSRSFPNGTYILQVVNEAAYQQEKLIINR